MIETNGQLVQDVVERVLQQVRTGWSGRVPPTPGKSAAPPITSAARADSAPGTSRFGQFADVGEAVAAAKAAQAQLMTRSLAQRKIACDLVRRICIDQADRLGQMEYEETRIGRAEHKPEKLVLAGERGLGVEYLRIF